MPALPLAQFPWPLILGGSVGFVLALGVSIGGVRRKGLPGVLATVAFAAAAASIGAFVALVWLWVGPMSNPVASLYVCGEVVQFLSNEQFRQIALMTNLAWVLPGAALICGAVAAWSWSRGSRS